MEIKYPFFKHLAFSYYTRTISALKLLPKKGLILDLGCGDGAYIQEIINDNFIIGTDINFKILPKVRTTNSLFINVNAEKLPFKNNMFDSILCIDVIEHVENDKKIIKEVSRIIKKNGHLVISVPNKNFPFTYDIINKILKPFNKHLPIGIWGFGHKRIYSYNKLRLLLEKNKFKIERTEYLNHYLVGLIENYVSTLMKNQIDYTQIKKSKFVSLILPVTNFICKLDKKLFYKSKTSIGIMVLAKKC